MRVAHIITRMIVGGAQENTLFNCLDLVRLFGDDVLLLTGPALGPEGDLLQQQSLAEHGHGAKATNEVARRQPPSNDAGQGRGGGSFSVQYVDALRREIHPWRDWTSYRELRRRLAAFQPDVVHTHSAKGGMLGRLAAKSVGVPAIIHTVHGAPFHPYQRSAAREIFRRCERYAARRCHRLVSVADAMTDLLVEANVAPREQFVTIYSGMDVEPFLRADASRERVRSEWGFDDGDVVIGKVARLFHLKGHEYVMAAARRVVDASPHVRFLFVGDGVLRESLERQISAAGLTDRFRFTGLVPPSRIPELMGAMDVLVHTSLREGLARTLPQALIAGRPVVSYDIDGAREVVIPNATGMLLPPKSVDGLADALIRLADDPELRRRYGEEGRRRFTDQFRHETMTRRLRELYEEVLAGQGRGVAGRKA